MESKKNMKGKVKEPVGATLAAMTIVLLSFVAAAGLRDDFRSPQGTARENAGPLFWLHGAEAETPERLREYVGKVRNTETELTGKNRIIYVRQPKKGRKP